MQSALRQWSYTTIADNHAYVTVNEKGLLFNVNRHYFGYKHFPAHRSNVQQSFSFFEVAKCIQ
jgi:hypothetical protein